MKVQYIICEIEQFAPLEEVDNYTGLWDASALDSKVFGMRTDYSRLFKDKPKYRFNTEQEAIDQIASFLTQTWAENIEFTILKTYSKS
jgi:hypothetical protein